MNYLKFSFEGKTQTYIKVDLVDFELIRALAKSDQLDDQGIASYTAAGIRVPKFDWVILNAISAAMAKVTVSSNRVYPISVMAQMEYNPTAIAVALFMKWNGATELLQLIDALNKVVRPGWNLELINSTQSPDQTKTGINVEPFFVPVIGGMLDKAYERAAEGKGEVVKYAPKV